jgi:glucose-6-phosphate isomerase
LHTALRAPPDRQPPTIGDAVHEELARLVGFADAVRTGAWRGFTGKAITTIVHIGIGGSHLGPELAVDALAHCPGRFEIHFVANVDGAALARALATADPETTLFTIVSKSFTTLETRENAKAARGWFLERTGRVDAIAQHFVAVTANPSAAAGFGLPASNLFPIWDWVGGRYSMWSAVGIPIALAIGPGGFEQLLAGAHAMDRHFAEAPAHVNAPLIAALLGVWNFNFLGVTNHAILPYDQRLRLLPNYLQQLETESNGKRVRHGGEPVGVHTMAILWGGEGTTGQHAFHQMLHQGTRSFTADFIVARTADHPWPHQHRWLVANCFSQSQAMLVGRQSEDPHRTVPGEHSTSTIVIDALSPATLGGLLAFYEHKVFCQGLIWDINSFDQWGVELGKQLANVIFDQLDGASTLTQDEPTRALIARALRARPRQRPATDPA